VAQELKWLGAQLGEENDTEAMTKEVDRLLAALPQNLIVGPVERELEHELGQLAQQGKNTIQAALASDRYMALQHMLDQLLTDPPFARRADRPAPTELPKNLARPSADSIADSPRPTRLHLDRRGMRRCTRRARPTSRCAT